MDRHVQQAALLEAVVRHVLVRLRETTGQRDEQRIAVLAVPGDGVGLVDRLVALGRQEIGLRQLGPAGEVALPRAVQLAHFLQADDVGVELLDGMAEVVDLQPPRGPDALHTLVDVVGGDPRRSFDRRIHRANCGSNRIASALDGEKQASAASR